MRIANLMIWKGLKIEGQYMKHVHDQIQKLSLLQHNNWHAVETRLIKCAVTEKRIDLE